MRRKIIVMFLSLFFFVLASASATDRGALFKVAGNGHVMYLFGTMHVGLPEFYPLEPRIASAIAGASVLALEIDPQMSPEAMGAALSAHGMMEKGADVFDTLSPPDRARVQAALARAHIAPADVMRFKPWLVATLLALAEYGAQGYNPALSVDAHLAKMARSGKVKLVELESIDAQLSMFNRLSPQEQVEYLKESVTMIESGRQSAEVRQIVEAWSNADKAALDDIAVRAEKDTSLSGRFVQKIMIDERNVTMAAKLAHMLTTEKNSVAAVGVLHLVGTKSVPVLLKAQGMTVERVY
jgi:uncharacterized protein YbaP (TraB family)